MDRIVSLMLRVGGGCVYAALIVSLVNAPGSAGVAPTSGATIGTVATMEGAPEIERAGAWSSLQIGGAISVGDEIRSGADTRLRILLQDGSVLNQGTNSQASISEYTVGPTDTGRRTVIQLTRGTLGFIVGPEYGKPGAAFEVKTTAAVATVHGTEAVMSHDPVADTSQVIGVTSQVYVYSTAHRTRGVLVKPREMTTIAKGGLPAPPRELIETVYRQRMRELEFAGLGRPEAVGAALRTAREVPPEDRAPRRTHRGVYQWWPGGPCSTNALCGTVNPPPGPTVRVIF